MPLAIFGIDSDELNLVVNLLILFLVVVWFALIAWTYSDARRRIEDPVLVASATAASLFPLVGTIVYSILRPPEFLEDRRERELEIRAAEMRLRQLEDQSCPNCQHPVERAYLRCPNCKARIHDPCEACGKPIDPRWSLCPYCETPVRHVAQPERRAATAARSQPTPAERVRSTQTAERRQPRTQQAEAPAKATPRKRPRKAPTRQSRAPRAAAQRATTAKQRSASAKTAEVPPAPKPGDDKHRPAPAS
ncbi:MAG TPA: zinc ribbon domain-containing protein [Solirubrobacterales bacterium]|jgi:Double zinc ribbon|nr:zinc ribbon domain-containing protein [Solirubrobacterales bacterium]